MDGGHSRPRHIPEQDGRAVGDEGRQRQPGVSVTSASASGVQSGTVSMTATSAPWHWFMKATADTPKADATRFRFSVTSAGSSPTRDPRLSES